MNKEKEAILNLLADFHVSQTGNEGPRNEAKHRRGPHVQSRKLPILTTGVTSFLEWPTDTMSIDYYESTPNNSSPHCPHTVLLFIPGNPGCVGWYIDMLLATVSRLGVGYAARGVSYAGHGVTPDICNVEEWETVKNYQKRNVEIPWTVDGQIQHKIEWVDSVVTEMSALRRKQASKEKAPPTRYVFISHSIGAHMAQRLCVLRPDILLQTNLLIHLMPYTRMDAPQPQQTMLSTGACNQDTLISIFRTGSRIASLLPTKWVDSFMRKTVPNEKDRKLAVGLIRQPTYARNFYELGTEEIRDVPERPDDSALRIIGRHCPTAMLYCGGPDQWAPSFHVDDLKDLQQLGYIPRNIKLMYMPELLHDFIVRPKMVPKVVDFCCQSILETNDGALQMKSKL